MRRMHERQSLLKALNDRLPREAADGALAEMDSYRQQAFSLLDTNRVRRAFDVQAEPDSIRERYGRNFFGQSVLMGRRLLEAGVRLVHVNCMSSIYGGDKNWDTHKDNFKLLADVLLPRTDQGIAALVEDLSASGLLDETLVVVTGEFGRTPKINKGAGRDHWPQCFSVLLAGAGLPGGRIYGSSDKHGTAPASDPVTSSELSATILHALGLDPETQLATQAGRPWQISDARPVTRLWS